MYRESSGVSRKALREERTTEKCGKASQNNQSFHQQQILLLTIVAISKVQVDFTVGLQITILVDALSAF
jgi:hypothetical protein